MSNPHVETLMRSLREPLYKAGLTPKTPMAARVLLRAIKDGACPCFLADLRETTDRLCSSSDSCALNRFSCALARRRVSRLMPAPIPSGRAFQHSHQPISMPQTNNSAADALVATQALQRQYEAFIREAPEQWMWAHRKWD